MKALKKVWAVAACNVAHFGWPVRKGWILVPCGYSLGFNPPLKQLLGYGSEFEELEPPQTWQDLNLLRIQMSTILGMVLNTCHTRTTIYRSGVSLSKWGEPFFSCGLRLAGSSSFTLSELEPCSCQVSLRFCALCTSGGASGQNGVGAFSRASLSIPPGLLLVSLTHRSKTEPSRDFLQGLNMKHYKCDPLLFAQSWVEEKAFSLPHFGDHKDPRIRSSAFSGSSAGMDAPL